MATTMTLAQLRTAVRQRADMLYSQFVTDSELNSYINQSAFELYDILIQKFGDDYYIKQPAYTFQTDGTNFLYALPSDFYKLVGVDLAINQSPASWTTIWNFNFGARNVNPVPNVQGLYGFSNIRVRVSGNNLWVSPVPSANQTFQIWYAPRMTTLSADSDTFDGISGWTEYIICDAAIKCKDKQESDTQVLLLEKQGLIQRIESAAENRNASAPATVMDKRSNDGYGFGDGMQGPGGGFWY